MTTGVVNNWPNLGVTGTISPDGIVTGSIVAASLRTGPNSAPSGPTGPGQTGEIIVDANFIYVCTAPNTWKRVAIATWVAE